MHWWQGTFAGSIVVAVLTVGLVGFTANETRLTDEQIASAIQSRLSMDGRVDPSMVVVKVEEGRVTLSGMVKSLEEKIVADAIVSATVVGVQSLVNNIIVAPPVVTKDPAIKLAIEQAFRSVPVLRGHKLTVDVSNGVARLDGTVEKPLQSRAAQKAAEKVQGVVAVLNLIKVTGKPRSDKEIEKDLVTYLQWSPLVNIDVFDYSVQNGVVKLKGNVDHLSQRFTLEEDIEKIHGVVGVDLSGVRVKRSA